MIILAAQRPNFTMRPTFGHIVTVLFVGIGICVSLVLGTDVFIVDYGVCTRTFVGNVVPGHMALLALSS